MLIIILIRPKSLWLLMREWLICPERVTRGVYDVTPYSQLSTTHYWPRIRNKTQSNDQNALHEFVRTELGYKMRQ